MRTVFVPWRQFFEQTKKQSTDSQWLSSALFNDHGALIDELTRRAPKKPVLRLRRDAEAVSDLREVFSTR
jgi:hypothetical protein